jgi:hypothetical protein
VHCHSHIHRFYINDIYFLFLCSYLIRSISAELSGPESVTPVPPWGGVEEESASVLASVTYIALLYALLRREGSDEGGLRRREEWREGGRIGEFKGREAGGGEPYQIKKIRKCILKR